MSIRQTEIKRLLAYSSIVHVAFLLMGDSTSSLMYLLTYIITSLLLFSVLLSVEVAGREIIYLSDLQFIRGSNDFQVICLVLALASSAGLPPFAGFYGKLLVWSSLIEDIYLFNDAYSYLVLFLSIGVSLITIYYYMRILAYLFVGGGEHLCAPHLLSLAPQVNSYINNLLTSQLVLAIFAAA
jgi:NADH-quinone oxidoreductase subunit N